MILPKYKGFEQEKKIGEYTLYLPDPPNLKDIAYKDLPQHKQKFQRTELPKDIMSWDAKARYDFESEEWEKRVNGFWFWNNGQLEYITGTNYLFVNWWKVEGGYPMFTDAQRDLFWLWKFKVIDNPKARGLIFLTGRRFGKTHIGNILGYDKITQLPENQHAGIQSKSAGDAKAVFLKLVLSWKYLPYFFKPVDSGDSNPSSQLSFTEPSRRDTKNQKKEYGLVLNSFYDYKPSQEVAYDGARLEYSLQDEIGKDEENNVYERIQVVKECVFDGGVIGKIFATSTVEEMEKKGGKWCKKIWDSADPNGELMPNGETQMGLLRYFNPAYYGDRQLDEKGERFINEYGYTDKERAKAYLEKKRATIKDRDLRTSERRKYPITINDCFISDSRKSVYDTIKIEQQLNYNETLPVNLLRRGDFYWENGIKDSKVLFNENENGRWLIAWRPSLEDSNKALSKYGKKAPGNTDVGCFGLDPYDNKTTVDNRKSDAASYGLLKYDPMKPYDSGIFISEYVNRPKLPEAMWEDMIMQCVYYGWEILIESNKIGTINYFRIRGYENYLMDRPEETQTASSEKMKEKGIPMSGEEARMALINATESYIINKVGMIEEDGEEARMGKCYFDTLLGNWRDFDFDKKWTEFDSMVGGGLAILGSRKYIPKMKERKQAEFFKRYNNFGIESKPI